MGLEEEEQELSMDLLREEMDLQQYYDCEDQTPPQVAAIAAVPTTTLMHVGMNHNNATPQNDDVEWDLHQTLKKYWGHDSFRPHQLELCKSLLEGRDGFFMTATGSGKSLIYQLPAITLRERGVKACCLVISPLLSLIEDQVSSLLLMGIPACALGSQSSVEIEQLAMDGHFALVYTTPEKISSWTRGLRALQQNAYLVCCAVDESHCVSEWGVGFRPEYRGLGQLRDICGPQVPIMALTASATDRIEQDIVNNLKLVDPLRIRTSVNRTNLKYLVKEKHTHTDVVRCLVEYRKKQLQGMDVNMRAGSVPYDSTIVYVTSRKATSDLARDLVQCSSLPGIKVAYYHAGMTGPDRVRIHNAFLRDEVQVIIATNAFGMGINKPDIRLIIHYGLPMSIESYYQQTGRAGRDAVAGTCVLFWNRGDEIVCRSLLQQNGNDDAKQLEDMKAYARSDCPCRRRYLLEYFNESVAASGDGPAVDCCDVCDQKILDALRVPNNNQNNNSAADTVPTIDVSKEVYMLLRTISDCKERFGLNVPVSILLGRNDQQTKRVANHTELTFFGQGKMHTETWWKALAYQLEEYDHLIVKEWTQLSSSSYGYHRFTISDAAKTYLFGNISIYSGIQTFDPQLHRIELNLGKDFLKAYEIEIAVRRSEERTAHDLARPPLSRSSTSARPDADSQRFQTFENYVDSDDGDENPIQNQENSEQQIRSQLTFAIRSKRIELSAQNGLNPYTIMTAQEIANLENHIMSTLSETPTVTAATIRTLLSWPAWKSSFAEAFACAVTAALAPPHPASTQLMRASSSTDQTMAAKPVSLYIPQYHRTVSEEPNTQVSEDEGHTDITSFLADDSPQPASIPAFKSKVERENNVDDITSFLADDSPERNEPSVEDNQEFDHLQKLVGLKRTSSTEASNKACKKRLLGLTKFKARPKVV